MSVLHRATLILDALAESRRPLTVSELATRTGLARSSAHRVLQSLEEERLVVRSPETVGYVLGPGLLKFGMGSHLRLLAANRSHLAVLAREVNENVDLAVFSGREVVVVDQIASPARLRGVTKVGQSFSLHGSCIGKALLAQLPDARVRELLEGPLRAFTPATITDVDRLVAQVDEVRRTGVAVDREEHDRGIAAVATAYLGPTGALQAVSVVMASHLLAEKWDLAVGSLARLPGATVDVAAARAQRALAGAR
ncbi:IclR family transcriptional regulator [Nocardioides bruguierae]|uniref:IclR family transcriptional regulator n=1 Tax=Nocardioides bruguierae TaxID=2945102 RepID=A0A9X2DB91_9ACTN|nr:IclR family transcriptional regulator [Nocardioides bruguierae]MCM0621419.1 IclR family transcriptional regulator [Nocardioides bruguierae]